MVSVPTLLLQSVVAFLMLDVKSFFTLSTPAMTDMYISASLPIQHGNTC